MLKNVLVAVFVLAIAGSAMATVDIQGQGAITVQLTIQPYTQIWFQNDVWQTPPAGDLDIIFGTTDYASPVLIGPYAGPANTEDPAAYGYFESLDGATIFMQSNLDFTGTLTSTGDIKNAAGDSLFTWFTIAVTGWDPVNSINDPNGFRLGNSGSGTGWVADGPIPGGTMGGYAGDNTASQNIAGPLTFTFGAQDFYPTQDAFQMGTLGSWVFDMDAPVGPGTMKFLARVLRNGIADPSGVYTSTLTPFFSVP